LPLDELAPPRASVDAAESELVAAIGVEVLAWIETVAVAGTPTDACALLAPVKARAPTRDAETAAFTNVFFVFPSTKCLF